MSSSEVVPDLLPRIAGAAYAAHDAEDGWRLRIRHRDQLICQAVDAGVSQREVARSAGLSKGRVVAIMVASQSQMVTVSAPIWAFMALLSSDFPGF